MQGAAPAPGHYGTLGIDQGASQEEVRRAFRAAALRTHPDKASGSSAAAAAAAGDGQPRVQEEQPSLRDLVQRQQQPSQQQLRRQQQQLDVEAEYLRVQAAWAVLSDPAARAEYDRQLALQAAASQVAVADTLPLSALRRQSIDGEDCLAWPCRCGGCFAIAAEEAGEAAAEAAVGGDGGVQQAHDRELLLPCTTCSLHILVTL